MIYVLCSPKKFLNSVASMEMKAHCLIKYFNGNIDHIIRKSRSVINYLRFIRHRKKTHLDTYLLLLSMQNLKYISKVLWLDSAGA